MPTPLDGRIKNEGQASVALAFVFLAIVALVAVPSVGARKTRPLYAELTDVIAPARGLVTRINVALAVEGSLLRDYVDSRDAALTARYREAYQRELSATTELDSVVASLGKAKLLVVTFRQAQRQWHDQIDRALAEPSRLAARDPLREDDYERLLALILSIDEELEAIGGKRRAAIERLESIQTRLAGGLGLLAAVAAVIVGWLAHRMRRSTLALGERQVALERATESRSRLMRGVTHDLKNPLHAISGHAQLLEDGVFGPMQERQRDSVMRIRKAVRSMLALIDDLLDLARAEAGQLRVRLAPVDIAAVLRDAVEQHRPSAEVAKQTLTLAAAAGIPVETDAQRVKQILGNLLSNAVKYTPAGGHIVVRAEARDRATDMKGAAWLAIDVSDDGDGVPEAEQPAIFLEFTRLSPHEAIPGAGLGLSISRRIAALLGGDLTLSSVPGKGATFTLWLPMRRRSDLVDDEGDFSQTNGATNRRGAGTS